MRHGNVKEKKIGKYITLLGYITPHLLLWYTFPDMEFYVCGRVSCVNIGRYCSTTLRFA